MRVERSPVCFYCEKPSLLGLTHPRCKRNRGIDGFLSLYLYDGLFKKLLLAAKYKGSYKILETLLMYSVKKAAVKIGKWSELFKASVISVPLHPKRIKERGFNQSDYIADMCTQGGKLKRDINLVRMINTPHLAPIIDKQERKKKIKNAFQYKGTNPPNTVILVDDVITSGSTILECAKALKEKGVRTVLAFSLAKG